MSDNLRHVFHLPSVAGKVAVDVVTSVVEADGDFEVVSVVGRVVETVGRGDDPIFVYDGKDRGEGVFSKFLVQGVYGFSTDHNIKMYVKSSLNRVKPIHTQYHTFII